MSLERYGQLVRKADAFFAKVHDAHQAEMPCGSGCHDCCHQRLTITAVEAAHLEEGLATLDDGLRKELARRASTDHPHCPALNDRGQCDVYAFRPLVCRTHGAPLRVTERRQLRVVSTCHLCFAEGTDHVRAHDVLDQETLSMLLAAVNAEWSGTASLERVPLADVLRRYSRQSG